MFLWPVGSFLLIILGFWLLVLSVYVSSFAVIGPPGLSELWFWLLWASLYDRSTRVHFQAGTLHVSGVWTLEVVCEANVRLHRVSTSCVHIRPWAASWPSCLVVQWSMFIDIVPPMHSSFLSVCHFESGRPWKGSDLFPDWHRVSLRNAI